MAPQAPWKPHPLPMRAGASCLTSLGLFPRLKLDHNHVHFAGCVIMIKNEKVNKGLAECPAHSKWSSQVAVLWIIGKMPTF